MACWCARRPSCQSRLPLSCPPGDPHGPPALYHFPWHRNIPTGLIELFSLMSLLFAVSTSRFSSSHRPHLSDPTIRVYLCDMAVTFSRPYNHLADPISITPVGSPFLNFRRFTTALSTYPEKPTRLISHAQIIRYLSFPLAPTIFIHSDPNPKNAVLGEKFYSPFLVVFRRLFVAWPRTSCPRSLVVHPRDVMGGGLRTCTIFFINHRPFPLSVSRGQHSPSRPSPSTFCFLSNGRRIFLHTFCHPDLSQPHFPVLEILLRSTSHTHNTPQMLLHAPPVRSYLFHFSTITSHVLIASSTSFVCTSFSLLFGLSLMAAPSGFRPLVFATLCS